MRRLRRGRSLRSVSAAVAAAVAALTLLGALGASPGTAVVELTDGGSWLWSTAKGWVTHVNGPSGKPDFNVELAASRGHPVELTQDGVSVLVTDLETGEVSRIDPATMELVSRSFGESAAVRVVALGDLAYVIETDTGVVTRIDPRTLDIIGERIHLDAPVTGAGLDADGVLWVAVARSGELIAVRDGRRLLAVPVSAPGSALTMTVAGGRPVAVDATTPALLPVASAGADQVESRAADRSVALPPPAGGNHRLTVAPTIDGRVVPVLVEDTAVVLLVDLDANDGDASVDRVELAGQQPSADLGAPVIAAGRVYVPDNQAGRVLVYDRAAGRFEEPIQLAGGPGMLTLFVRNGTVWMNDAAGTNAVAVDSDGRRHRVDKYAPDAVVPVVDKSVPAPPPPVPEPSATRRRPSPPERSSRPPATAPVPGPQPAPLPGPTSTAPPPALPLPSRTTAPPATTPPTTTPPTTTPPTTTPTTQAPAAPGAPSVSVRSASGAVVYTVTAGAGGPAVTFAITTSTGESTTISGPGPTTNTSVTHRTDCPTVQVTAVAIGPGGESPASVPAQALGCVPPGPIQNVTQVDNGAQSGSGWAKVINWQPPADDGGGTITYVITMSDHPGGSPPYTYTDDSPTIDRLGGAIDYQKAVIQARNAAGAGPGTKKNESIWTRYQLM
ncbi:hypothetical protein UG55_10052 [Frankia sp. EI5c]|uniref:hypothetical protein n=1 Tax=Frankia sp. EI5c TaxID=683316 RepID=UPI0007C3D768|nr:hypothetical protein [Frankia sp. EI5c]OAA28490.1 hypothetical protein UG55_10052 [Frankia sp. EI5c]